MKAAKEKTWFVTIWMHVTRDLSPWFCGTRELFVSFRENPNFFLRFSKLSAPSGSVRIYENRSDMTDIEMSLSFGHALWSTLGTRPQKVNSRPLRLEDFLQCSSFFLWQHGKGRRNPICRVRSNKRESCCVFLALRVRWIVQFTSCPQGKVQCPLFLKQVLVSSTLMTRGVAVYFSQDFYSPTCFVVSTTSSDSQVVKNFHLGLL